MATKGTIKRADGAEFEGYHHDKNLGLFLNPETNLWQGIHLATGNYISGPRGKFKRKRSCIRFLEHFENLNWDVATDEEMLEANGGFDAVKVIYDKAYEEAMKLE